MDVSCVRPSSVRARGNKDASNPDVEDFDTYQGIINQRKPPQGMGPR